MFFSGSLYLTFVEKKDSTLTWHGNLDFGEKFISDRRNMLNRLFNYLDMFCPLYVNIKDYKIAL